MWSGRVNAVVSEVANSLAPGTALDLGCGEGGDAIWLAKHGWKVTGVDVSPTAVERARAAARSADLITGSVTFVAADLATWQPTDTFDLVTSAFLHSWPVIIPRDDVLRTGRDALAPGGSLLILAHAEAPPWADPEFVARARFPKPEEDLEALSLDQHWVVERCGVYEREASGPDGRPGVLRDSVVLARRLT